MEKQQPSNPGVEAKAVLDEADLVISEADLTRMYDRMAKEIHQDLAELDPVVLCVMMGGFVVAAELLRRLRFPFTFDYLHATRYRGETQGGELVWKVSPGIVLEGRHVLVIDDILDEGHTLDAILRAIEGQGAASVRSAILLRKQHDRREREFKVDYLGGDVEDRYVFGAGMDYRGYYRQLPAVYALKGS
ncbi:MAG: hypoxanthine-guanine phosphoribosyltransferase [Salinisphaeraceae bacterium]|nr:hypoxanthine-guanine phosphoribosyltransferase [Salinisphaeraceae bacterium]